MPDTALDGTSAGAQLDRLLGARAGADRAFFTAEAERLARLCHRMAERFSRGGRLLAVGATPAARSDAHHVAVEFVHPVIVGKRALPALALTGSDRRPADALAALAREEDIVMVFGADEDGGEGTRSLDVARERSCLSVAFAPAGAEWEFAPPSRDRYIRQELTETLYHLLWELVHVFFEHRGLLEGRDVRQTHDAGAASFLYPFLGEEERGLDAVVADVRASVQMKADETAALRERTVADNRAELLSAAAELRRRLETGGTLLALGNGGSATDAMDVAADFADPRLGDGSDACARRVIDLCGDPSILTAIANDIGTDAIFSRQIIALGGPADAVLALSTSGNSASIISALAEARRRGLQTIAMVGYGGGRVGDERLADQVIVTRSEHIPRIQEAQATAYHVLRELVEQGDR